MNDQELQLAFIQFLAQKTGAKNQQELEAIIQQLGEEGLKQAYAEFMQMMQLRQVLAAKKGAKLNYIKQLRGQCPDGYDLQYFKKGGQLCKKCVAKQVMQEGGELKDPIELFKCGKKVKKHKQGGWINKEKGIWRYDSLELMNNIKNYMKTGQIDDKTGEYLRNNPELAAYLNNIYKAKNKTHYPITMERTTILDRKAVASGATPTVRTSRTEWLRPGLGNDGKYGWFPES